MGLFKKKQDIPPGRNPRANHETQGPVFSYYSSRAPGDARAARGQGSESSGSNSRLRWSYLPSYVALLALIISAGYVLSVDIRPRIVVDDNNQSGLLRDRQVYQHAGQALLASSPLNRSKITINALDISRRLNEQFPEIDTAVVALPLMSRRPVITIRPSAPALLLSTREGIYVLDVKGRAILNASDVGTSATATGLPVVTDESGLEIKLGKAVLPRHSVEFISDLQAQLSNKGLKIDTLTLPALADELHVRLENQPYFVKFNMATDARISAGTFMAVKERLERDGQIPDEYIDVRVEERAYYR